MAENFKLPKLDDLTTLMVTLDDVKSSDFVKQVDEDKVKMLVVDNKIACVVISPQLYASFISQLEVRARSLNTVPAAS